MKVLTDTTRSLSAGERLDGLKPGRYLLRWTLFVRFTMFWDFFDLSMAGALLGLWLYTGASTPALNGAFISATAFGMLVGNVVTSILVDRVGRKAVLQWGLLIVAATSLLSAVLPFSMEMLIALRFVCGTGLASIPVAATLLLVEITPASSRASWAFWSGLIAQAGLLASAVAGYFLLPWEGWRWMFAIPGAVCLLLLFLGRGMPESPRWLAERGRHAEADAVVKKFEQGQDVSTDEHPHPPMIATPSDHAPGFEKALYFRMLVPACVMKIAVNAGLYLFLQYLPMIMIGSGIDLSDSLGYNAVIASGTLLAGIAGGLIADRVGRRKMMVFISILGACCAGGFMGLLHYSPLLGMTAGFLLIAILGYLGTLVYLYNCEIFPTRVRGAYVGIATTASRVSNIVLPLAVVALASFGIGYAVTGLIAGLFIAVIIAVAATGVETAGVPLDAKTH